MLTKSGRKDAKSLFVAMEILENQRPTRDPRKHALNKSETLLRMEKGNLVNKSRPFLKLNHGETMVPKLKS